MEGWYYLIMIECFTKRCPEFKNYQRKRPKTTTLKNNSDDVFKFQDFSRRNLKN